MMLTEQDLDRFADELDDINDELTELCDDVFQNLQDMVPVIESGADILKKYGLELKEEDLQEATELEAPDTDEAVSTVVPVYRDGEQSEFSLSITYFFTDEFQIDMELQYAWESELDEDDIGFDLSV